MRYEKESFLAGLAVGRQLKGWGGSSAAAAFLPLCRCDAGVYDRFYIEYPVALQTFSYGRFCHKTAIFGAEGEIIPKDAVQLDGFTVCVFADITAQTSLRIYGSDGAGLTLADGRECPAYSARLWVDGQAPYSLGYLAESAAVKTSRLGPAEGFSAACRSLASPAVEEKAALQRADAAGREQLGIAYS